MKNVFRPAPLAMAAALATGAAHAATGLVVGAGYYQNAHVCVDTNLNGRCDDGEPSGVTSASGAYSLQGDGAIVAEVGTDAVLYDPAAGTSTPVTRAIVLRLPAQAAGAALGPISTEVQALMDGGAMKFSAAQGELATRLGVERGQLLADPNAVTKPAAKTALQNEQTLLMDRLANAAAEAGTSGNRVVALSNRLDLDRIDNIVVIYAENRSFNNLYGNFAGANGLKSASKSGQDNQQKDRDGSLLNVLPPAWSGLTAAGQAVTVTQAQTTNVWVNAPFQIDSAAPAWGTPTVDSSVVTRDLYHRFFENQMQIHGGANDMFAAWADSGGLVMGNYAGKHSQLWNVAQRYVLADNFFQGAFGGSFLNHQYLVCACAPEYPNADTAAAHPTIAALQLDGNGHYTPNLAIAANSPASALSGPPSYVLSGNIAPKDYFGDGTFRAINTMQPAFQPSGNAPGGDDPQGLYANPLAATTLPAQTQAHIGDLLAAKGLNYAYYAGGWNAASANRANVYNPATGNFQAHHQPLNYFAEFDPVAHADARAAHLKDYDDLVAAAAAGTLPPVAFYKPIGVDNQHAGYASVAQGDAHIADTLDKLRASPQWKHMLVIVTYDENGGFWDHVAPPKGDLVGPGTRIPALIVSPFVRRGTVDHTQYDSTSPLRFIAERWSLPILPGVQRRDASLVANGFAPMGDFTNSLTFAK
jgi:acid phosphatase